MKGSEPEEVELTKDILKDFSIPKNINFNFMPCTKCSGIPTFSYSPKESSNIKYECLCGNKGDMSIYEYMKQAESFEAKKKCSNPEHKREPNKVKYCVDCQKYLCDECLASHNKTHIYVLDNKFNIQLNCKKDQKPIYAFCTECKEHYCSHCIKEHREHKIYLFEDIEKYVKDKRRKLKHALKFVFNIQQYTDKFLDSKKSPENINKEKSEWQNKSEILLRIYGGFLKVKDSVKKIKNFQAYSNCINFLVNLREPAKKSNQQEKEENLLKYFQTNSILGYQEYILKTLEGKVKDVSFRQLAQLKDKLNNNDTSSCMSNIYDESNFIDSDNIVITSIVYNKKHNCIISANSKGEINFYLKSNSFLVKQFVILTKKDSVIYSMKELSDNEIIYSNSQGYIEILKIDFKNKVCKSTTKIRGDSSYTGEIPDIQVIPVNGRDMLVTNALENKELQIYELNKETNSYQLVHEFRVIKANAFKLLSTNDLLVAYGNGKLGLVDILKERKIKSRLDEEEIKVVCNSSFQELENNQILIGGPWNIYLVDYAKFELVFKFGENPSFGDIISFMPLSNGEIVAIGNNHFNIIGKNYKKIVATFDNLNVNFITSFCAIDKNSFIIGTIDGGVYIYDYELL